MLYVEQMVEKNRGGKMTKFVLFYLSGITFLASPAKTEDQPGKQIRSQVEVEKAAVEEKGH